MPTKKWSPVKITSVDDVVAEEWWEYHWKGRKLSSRVAVGRPLPDPSGQDWYCPLFFEHVTDGWDPIYGVTAVGALTNAMNVVGRLFHELGPSPRARKRAKREDQAWSTFEYLRLHRRRTSKSGKQPRKRSGGRSRGRQ